MEMMKVWCLFSVDSNYDQPDFNLVCFWKDKPSLEQLSNVLTGKALGDLGEETIVEIVSIFTGKEGKVSRVHFDTTFRIEEVEEGIQLPTR
jgi:hypothetical protein